MRRFWHRLRVLQVDGLDDRRYVSRYLVSMYYPSRSVRVRPSRSLRTSRKNTGAVANSGHHRGVERLINKPRAMTRRADCAAQSAEAPEQRPHERA
jgi:hypothetical protein